MLSPLFFTPAAALAVRCMAGLAVACGLASRAHIGRSQAGGGVFSSGVERLLGMGFCVHASSLFFFAVAEMATDGKPTFRYLREVLK